MSVTSNTDDPVNDVLDDVRDLAIVTVARGQPFNEARTARNDAIRRARRSGATLRQIAAAAEMTPAGVAKILEVHVN